MDNLSETFDELNLGCEKTLCKQFNEGGKQKLSCFHWQKQTQEKKKIRVNKID